eukprot:3488830-Amphidinium_carterae.1
MPPNMKKGKTPEWGHAMESAPNIPFKGTRNKVSHEQVFTRFLHRRGALSFSRGSFPWGSYATPGELSEQQATAATEPPQSSSKPMIDQEPAYCCPECNKQFDFVAASAQRGQCTCGGIIDLWRV